MSKADLQSFQSVEEAEKRLRQATSAEHAVALNNHADRLVDLQKHHEAIHQVVTHLQDQMSCVLDGLTQINRRLDRLEGLGVLADDLRQTVLSEQITAREKRAYRPPSEDIIGES